MPRPRQFNRGHAVVRSPTISTSAAAISSKRRRNPSPRRGLVVNDQDSHSQGSRSGSGSGRPARHTDRHQRSVGCRLSGQSSVVSVERAQPLAQVADARSFAPVPRKPYAVVLDADDRFVEDGADRCECVRRSCGAEPVPQRARPAGCSNSGGSGRSARRLRRSRRRAGGPPTAPVPARDADRT